MRHKRRICFVTGTRAEFGLMESALKAIAAQSELKLQIIATGMHLDHRHGRTINSLTKNNWKIAAKIPWPAAKSQSTLAHGTGVAIARLCDAFDRLKSDAVLIVGDRVEAFAAASAAHLSGRIVAHVHGGDRALGQVDDSLRHAITKLSHIHFAATRKSAKRIRRLGEDNWRIHVAGAPGIDGIRKLAAPAELPKHQYAVLILHPIEADDRAEYKRATLVLNAVAQIGLARIVIVHPNNDPGARGIAKCWNQNSRDERFQICKNIDRPHFLGLMRDAAVLIGNSSSGIIEAASFGTPVIDIGPRQRGRQRSGNVTNVPYSKTSLVKAIRGIWNGGNPRRIRCRNVYGGDGSGRKIAKVLSSVALDGSLLRKLIAY